MDKDKNILIVGLGLMGGSIAKALKRREFKNVSAIEINTDIINKAEKEGIITKGYLDPSEVIPCADLVIICLYPKQTVEFINKNMSYFKTGAVITDIAGVKQYVMDNVSQMRKDIDFIGGHPMAGLERKGFKYSTEKLFDACNYILIPHEGLRKESFELVKELALSLGSKKVVISSPKEHDEYIAYTSQIPHVVAIAYMNAMLDRKVTDYSAGSFRDVTRVAMINEEMWSELFIDNKEKLIKELDGIREQIELIEKMIISEDKENLMKYMKKVADKREEIEKCK